MICDKFGVRVNQPNHFSEICGPMHFEFRSGEFGDIYCFPDPVAIRTAENLLQAKLAETSLLFSKFYNSSTKTFEINI